MNIAIERRTQSIDQINAGTSDEVGHITGHFRDTGVIELLNILQRSPVTFSHKVDSNSFTAETATSSDSEN